MAVVGPSWQKAFLHVMAQGFRVIAMILSPLSFHKRKKNERRQIYVLNTFPLGPVSWVWLYNDKSPVTDSLTAWGLSWLGLHSTSQSIVAGNQGRNLETGDNTEAAEESCLLTCSSCFIIGLGTTAQGWYRSQWSGPSYSHHWSRKCFADLPTG